MMLPLGRDDLRDALSQLHGWSGDYREIRRTLRLDDSEHAQLTERVKVAADALDLHPHVRRLDGYTQIRLCTRDGGPITADEVALAARIEAAYQTVLHSR